MRNLKKLIIIIFSFWFFINGTSREQLPNPELSSAKIEWWYPPYINPPTLHTTLTFFETGNIWKGVTDSTPKQEKLRIHAQFNKIINDLKNAKNLVLNEKNFSILFPFDETFGITGIDIISTHPSFANSYVFDITSKNTSINEGKFVKFKKTIETDAFERQIISTREGKKEVPKYHWYLVAKLDNNFTNFRNKLCSSKHFAPFTQSTKYAYIPHITLGRIDKIENLNVFLRLLKALNNQLTIEPKDHLEFKLNEIEHFVEDKAANLTIKNHMIYFELDKSKNNMIFMIKIGWKTLVGRFLRNLVKALPEKEKIVAEEIFKNSINSLKLLSSSLIALESQRA